jgi:hypothetical protein
MKKYVQINLITLFIIVAITLFANRSFAQNFQRNEYQFSVKGNQFEFQSQSTTAQTITDPVTNKPITKYLREPQPSSLNGKKIYELTEVTTPPIYNPVRVSPPLAGPADISLEQYLVNNLEKDTDLKQLSDGIVRINLKGIIADENGKIVYFEYRGARWAGKDGQVRTLGDGLLARDIDNWIANAQPMSPATLKGNKVAVRLNASLSGYKFNIQNHTLTCIRDNGQTAFTK